MGKQLVAAYDGVMVLAGEQYRTLYKDAAVPAGADEDHVKVLKDRGLLVEADVPDQDDADTDDDAKKAPAKSPAKAS